MAIINFVGLSLPIAEYDMGSLYNVLCSNNSEFLHNYISAHVCYF